MVKHWCILGGLPWKAWSLVHLFQNHAATESLDIWNTENVLILKMQSSSVVIEPTEAGCLAPTQSTKHMTWELQRMSEEINILTRKIESYSALVWEYRRKELMLVYILS